MHAQFRVHLIPAEVTVADDVLRFDEKPVSGNDGMCLNSNTSTGKYLLYAQMMAEKDLNNGGARPTAWDAIERARLRREAEDAKSEIELQPCGRVKDHVIKDNQ